MSGSSKSTPSGSQSSSQGFISRFWRQKLSNDNAPPAGPAYPHGMAPHGQYPGTHVGQPLEPPRVQGYTMPPSMSPATSPYNSVTDDPKPPFAQQQPQPSNFHAAPPGPTVYQPPTQPTWNPQQAGQYPGSYGGQQAGQYPGPYGGQYGGQPLEPPQLRGYAMPPSMSPAASPYTSVTDDPAPQPPPPNSSGNANNGSNDYTALLKSMLADDGSPRQPRPNLGPVEGPVQPAHGQDQPWSTSNPHGGTFTHDIPGIAPPSNPVTEATGPAPSSPALSVPTIAPAGKTPSIVVNPTQSDAGSDEIISNPNPPVGGHRLKSPDLLPDEVPTTPITPSGKGIATLAPPVSTIPLDVSPGLSSTDGFFPGPKPDPVPSTAEATETGPAYYDTKKPICSLNLVCYRSGAKGCELQQIQGILRSKYSSDESFEAAKATNKNLLSTDDQFFHEMARLYETKMCSFLRRHFSLKSLKAFRVLAYTPVTRPTVVPLDDFILQEMMYAYQNPDKASSTSDDWIQWMFRLRRKDKRHALEFVEGWNTTRIAISGTVPWLSSCLVGIIWTAMGGDVQSAFTVASFILTSSSIILALLAIISSIESSGPIH